MNELCPSEMYPPQPMITFSPTAPIANSSERMIMFW
jgi:hypothetical protein